jgi:hypothetical protein
MAAVTFSDYQLFLSEGAASPIHLNHEYGERVIEG